MVILKFPYLFSDLLICDKKVQLFKVKQFHSLEVDWVKKYNNLIWLKKRKYRKGNI